MDTKQREKLITRTSVIGIIANLFLVIIKAVAGMMAGSIAIVLDAINNLTDAMSSVVTIVGIKLAKKHPDEKHPFGYGRIEYFSAIIISFIILIAGVTSIVESAKKVVSPELPNYTVLTVIIVSISIVTKLVLGRYVKKKGKEYNSDALVASGVDASMDAIISLATLIGAAITIFAHISVDGIVGVIISIFIIKAGLEIFLEALSNVMGRRADSEITKEIKETVKSIEGVIGAYDLVLHNYGPNSAIGSIHVEVEDRISAADFHRISMNIRNKIIEQFHVFLTVGIYAVDIQDERKASMRENIIAATTAFDGVVNAHGVYIDAEAMRVTYDTVVDFTVKDKMALGNEIKAKIHELYSDYEIQLNFDTNFSD